MLLLYHLFTYTKGMKKNPWTLVAGGLLVMSIIGVCLQGPVSVFADVAVPDWALLVKSWKEAMVLIAGLIVALVMVHQKSLHYFVRDPFVWLPGVIAIVYGIALAAFPNATVSEFAALVISLRSYAVFVVVYGVVTLWPWLRTWLVRALIVGTSVVALVALLQVTVLPKDFLAYIGYSEATIRPYMTVDQNQDFIRINSTLRGPNPLGAFAMTAMSGLIAAWLRGWRPASRWQWGLLGVVATGLLAALWSSYSRSAWLAMIAALAVATLAIGARRISKKLWLSASVGIVVLAAITTTFVQTDFAQHVIFHTNPHSETVTKSDHEHAASLQEGIAHTLEKPFGDGLGSVGSPSLLGGVPRIVESQYFYTAAETGWLGLVLQLGLLGLVLWRAWQCRHNGLALAVVMSGAGLLLVGLVLPVWADDTIGMIWWTMAALALASSSQPKQQTGRAHA